MIMSATEHKAFQRAIHSHGAALVVRVRHGVYEVPSAGRDERYLVTGTSPLAAEMRCTCPAGQHGRPCWHRAAVQLRKTQEHWKAAQARAAQAAASTRQSVATLRIGGVEYHGTGTNLLEALAHAVPVIA